MTQTSPKARLRQALADRVPTAPAGHATALAERVLGLSAVSRARAVAAFVGQGHEPNTGIVLTELLAARIQVWLPRVVDRAGRMLFHPVSDPTRLQPGLFAIPEPADDGRGRDLRDTGVDVVLVPGVAFGEDGARLGQGGGFYDRALQGPAARPVLVGLCHDDRVLPAGQIPTDPHDVRVDWIITPDRVIRPGTQ